ncbi:hypothetical protein BDFB_002643 [Asbolus verrucosus]|uniref:Uncharacterized protein n=1 Tax=Asbolus verrucosus TaxID=1661398 RepID=A0A482VME0_ASBVE|nr:hypothetical protein BDFB_002643 [Asbolus verrucosus]
MSLKGDVDAVEDLIDLHVGSPVLPRISPGTSQSTFEEIHDNLIDSELPVLEQKLQISANSTTSNETRRSSVDVEDILITIDDDCDVSFAKSVRRSHSEVFLGQPKSHIDKSWSCDNLEALNVLQNLDEVLNASLLESDKILDAKTDEDQQSIEACLLDLDNYLQAYESSAFDNSNDDSVESNPSNCVEEQRSRRSSASSLHLSEATGSDSASEQNDGLRARLRQMEENYARFLASGCINRAYVDTETNGSIRRPSSACGRREGPLRSHPLRATIASPSRTSGPADDDVIDWGWVQEAARGAERRAHAAGDCCTGTVVVEPLHRALTEPGGSSDAMAEASKDRRGTTWLRTSMRRLRHFRLPSDGTAGDVAAMEATGPSTQESAVARPVSAPSRLLPGASQRSRSRTRGQSAVSNEPGGRARSSSASSRSRRPRSLSSSVSSLASTVDSSPSCTPAPTPTQNEAEQAATRR